MHILIDGVMVGSPGMKQLRDELATAVAAVAGEQNKITILIADGVTRNVADSRNYVLWQKRPRFGWFGRSYWYKIMLPRIAKQLNVDVIYSLSGIVSREMARQFPVVTTVNNMAPFTELIMSSQKRFSKERMRLELLKRIYLRSLRRANRVVLHSEHAKKQLINAGARLDGKADVVLTGVPTDLVLDGDFKSQHPYSGSPYFLYFTAIYPYKHHIELVEGYHKALEVNSDLPDLLLAGMPNDAQYLRKIKARIEQLGIGEKVKYIGVLKRKDIPNWLQCAEVNFFPSTCETNSVVLAEILGLGGVLACSNMPPMSEIAGYAAELFDPYSPQSIADVLIHLNENSTRRDQLRERSLARAGEISWLDCGETIWKAAYLACEDRREENV